MAEGIRSVVMNAVLPDGSAQQVRLRGVLYVSKLDCALFFEMKNVMQVKRRSMFFIFSFI